MFKSFLEHTPIYLNFFHFNLRTIINAERVDKDVMCLERVIQKA